MRIAMIGAGGMAHRHAQTLATFSGVEIAGVVSANPARAAAAAAEWESKAFPDVESLLAAERVDAAWICVPPGAHGPTEEALCRRSIPFFVEKPLAANRAAAEQLADLVARAGVIAAVGYHWRAMDTIPEVRATLAARPAKMVNGSWLGSLPQRAWWRRREKSGGQIIEQATHLFDLARVLMGEGWVEAAMSVPGPHPDDPEADVDVLTTALLRFGRERSVPAVFTAASLLPTAAAVHLQIVCVGMLITIARAGVTYEGEGGRRTVDVGNDPFESEDRAFLEAVARRDPASVYCLYSDALETHRLCCDVMDAAR